MNIKVGAPSKTRVIFNGTMIFLFKTNQSYPCLNNTMTKINLLINP
ncbi:Uncharacterised protein [Legionella pneumophila subsp. pascullei]|uniref:Uncharacterized protein n=1 Tax=Legionella pneumophila subsp. pascullei TaxID=91890 RepID=A0AAX2IY70_LEGPN|nr:Uncharacterised protein [Legionella pneumophila subsp. pascullei]VEH07378.1 Uncharacterised protein [Legionella pneumophila subsp. pascullei]